LCARSLDFGRTWVVFRGANKVRKTADKPVLAVHERNVLCRLQPRPKNSLSRLRIDAGQTFASGAVNPNAGEGSSLAGGGTGRRRRATLFWLELAYVRRDAADPAGQRFRERFGADGGLPRSTFFWEIDPRTGQPPGPGLGLAVPLGNISFIRPNSKRRPRPRKSRLEKAHLYYQADCDRRSFRLLTSLSGRSTTTSNIWRGAAWQSCHISSNFRKRGALR